MATSEPAQSTLRAIGITVVTVIGIAFLRGCGWHTYGTLDPLVPPPKLNVFGRDYRSAPNRHRRVVLRHAAAIRSTSSSRPSARGRRATLGRLGGGRPPTVVWLQSDRTRTSVRAEGGPCKPLSVRDRRQPPDEIASRP